MADDQTQTVDPNEQQAALVQQLLRQTLTGQAAQPQEPPHSGDNRTWGSLLGQALVGGAGPGSTDAQNEMAGLRALQSIGLGMMQGSDYSQARHSLGSIVANAIGGAQESNYAQNAAQLEYQKTQQELQLGRVKEAIPLLTMLQTLQQQKALRGMPSSLGTTAPGANVNLGAVGPVPSGILTPNEQPINAAGDSATRKASEGGPPAPGTPGAKVAQQVHDFWIGKGLSEAQVAGILAGGPGSESNFDPTASGDKGTSIGLYQHHAERLDGMRKFFNLSADQMPTADQQNQYAAWEISPQGPKAAVGAALRTAQTAAEAAAIWTRSFGVPADKSEIGRRAAGAGRYLGLYGQPQPPGAPGAPVTAQTPPAGPPAAPGVAQGDIAHPELAPGPPGSTGGAPIGIGAALAPPVVAGTPLPAGKLQSTGKPPGQAAADIIQSGVQLAQATPLVRGTGQEAGPSSAVATLATPQPGWGTGAAAGYNVGTTGAASPPAPQIPSQASTQPQPPPAIEVTPPATTPIAQGPPTFTYTRHDPPPGMLQGATLTPEEQSVVADARNAYQNAIRVAITPEQRQQAEATLQTTLDKELTARAGRTDAAAKQLADWYANDFKQQQEQHKLAVDSFYKNREQQQQFQNQTQLELTKAEQQRLTNKEAVFNAANQEGLKTAQTEQAAARDTVAQLEGFRAISEGVGQPGWLQTTKWPGSDHTIAEQLQQAGIPLADTGGVQLLRGAMTNMVRTLRQGMAMGSLSDRDLNFIERMGPTEWMDPDTRAAAVGYLQQAYRAKMRFSSDVQKEMSRGKNYGDAVDAADAKQKPFVPSAPADLTAHWTDMSQDWEQRRKKWAQENDVRPGTLFHLSNGAVMILKARRPDQGQR